MHLSELRRSIIIQLLDCIVFVHKIGYYRDKLIFASDLNYKNKRMFISESGNMKDKEEKNHALFQLSKEQTHLILHEFYIQLHLDYLIKIYIKFA